MVKLALQDIAGAQVDVDRFIAFMVPKLTKLQRLLRILPAERAVLDAVTTTRAAGMSGTTGVCSG